MADPLTGVAAFFAELRRRKVIRVAIAYGIVGFAVTEVANNVLPPLGLEFATTLVVVLLLLGFPVALVLAWAFDLTPRGLERTPDRAPVAGQAVAIRPAAGTAAPAPASPELPENSIAALPFANLSGDPAQQYLSDGLTEELILALSRVPGLRVAARTSCFAVKNLGLDVRELGQRLNVRHVVDGGVRIADNRLRLSTQLVDVRSGYVEWSEQYERDLDDIFQVQQDLARAIVQRVTGSAAFAADQAVSKPGTANVDAFKLFLRGRYHWNRRTEADLRRAISFFEQAIELDESYAPAYAGLSDAYSLLLDYGGMAPAEGLDRARDAAEHALRLDPTLAEAYTSLALVRQFEFRWDEAEAAFRTSIERRPSYPAAHQRYSLLLAWLGRHTEATAEADLAESLDPLAVSVCASAGWVRYYARQYDDARTRLERALEMDPHFATARVPLALTLLQKGKPKEAEANLAQAVLDSGEAASAVALHAVALVRAGNADAGRALLERLEQRAETEYVSTYYLALPCIALNEPDRALDRLEAALRERAPQLAYIYAEPLLDPLRTSARFRALLGRVGLPV